MKRILIANRGEIALRIIRACRDAGYHSIAIASDADRSALPAREADECHVLPGNSPRETYLNQDAVLAIAARAHADAVHPGYGFLSENESFAAAVEAAGLTWIGPSPDSIARLGDKVAARDIARGAGAPLLPSWEGAEITAAKALEFVRANGLPVIIKAQNGGGGRGMRIVRSSEEIEGQFATASNEALTAFGDGSIYLEKYLEEPRHIEFQVFGDAYGNVIHLGERECSIQRRHQKLIEEAPSPALTPDLRARMGEASVKLARAVGYQGAGTIEYLLDLDGSFYFMEMNTRIQVEHPVTEMVTGVDLVKLQIRIAAGEPLTIPSGLKPRGHAIECRVNAEDPVTFVPSPGRLTTFHLPGGPGVRVDTHGYEDYFIPPNYDSLVAKLIVHAGSREEAVARMKRALDFFVVEGIKTSIPLHREILEDEEFRAGRLSTKFMERFAERRRLKAAALP